MTKDFRKKNTSLIKNLIKEKNMKLFRMKIYIGNCSKENIIPTCDFLLEMWHKMIRNHLNIFFKWFRGFTRELIVEIDGETCRPYLSVLLLADKKTAMGLPRLQSLALVAWLRISMQSNFDVEKDIVPLEEIPENEYGKVIDDLLLPCIRVNKQNNELEELLEIYQYGKQLCSRGGILSRKNLEYSIADRE